MISASPLNLNRYPESPVKEQNHQHETQTERKRWGLMRGLPNSGKSWTAQRLATGGQGAVFNFDCFFEREVTGEAGEPGFVWKQNPLPEARHWNFDCLRSESDAGTPWIIVDNDRRLDASANAMGAHEMLHNDVVENGEPASHRWQTTKLHFQDKPNNCAELPAWALKLSQHSRHSHGVAWKSFVARMSSWQMDLTPQDSHSWSGSPDGEKSNKTEVAA